MMTEGLDRFLGELQRVKPVGDGVWKASCPVPGHGKGRGDLDPSLSIGRGNGAGPAIYCHALCPTDAVLSAVGMSWRDFHSPKETTRRKSSPTTSRIVATYDYTDDAGVLLYQAVRYDPKDFKQRRPDPDRPGEWIWKIEGVSRVLYRLPELMKAVAAGVTIYVVEGEKDVDNLRTIGIAGTCNVGGAGKWKPEYSKVLRGAAVIVIPDNDKVGREHAAQVYAALLGIASSVKIVPLPGLPDKGDVSDWIAAGGTREQLEELAATVTTTVAEDQVPDLERFPLSDAGNAELLAALHGNNLRFDSNQNRRLTFGPHLWAEDKNGAWVRLAIKTARQRYLDAVNAPERKREAIARFALRAEDRNRITATLALAESLPPIADTGEEWDADPMLLGGPNGVVDLRTGKLRDGRREDRITKSVGVPFDAGARWTRWERNLLEIFDGNQELMDFVWRAVGYSITGSTREQVIFLLYGTGANGKTTFLNAIRRALGQYAHNAPFSTFEHDGRSSIPADVADLAGCRFITSSETGEASRLNEQRVKVLTGGDPVTARGFYKPFFTFTPTGKPWLSVNHKPRVTDDSHGFWRRVRLIPFLRQFKEDADRNLERILAEEAPGVLAWAVRGCLEWQARGLTPPAIVTDAVEDYRRESDPLGEFIAARCIVAPVCAAPGAMLYRGYQAWAKDAGLREREQLSNTSFGRRLGARFKKERRKGGVEYQGIGLLGGGE